MSVTLSPIITTGRLCMLTASSAEGGACCATACRSKSGRGFGAQLQWGSPSATYLIPTKSGTRSDRKRANQHPISMGTK